MPVFQRSFVEGSDPFFPIEGDERRQFCSTVNVAGGGHQYGAGMIASNTTHIDLSHVVTDGLVTYPGLPAPQISDHLSREAAEEIYGPGITFQIGMVNLCTNTGTYLDVPFHRYADGHDLTGLALERVANVPAVRLDCRDRRHQIAVDQTAIELSPSDVEGLGGHAVLVHTGHAKKWGSDGYFTGHPFLTEASAVLLRDADVACVGIDTLNIDSTKGGERPVHSVLLRAEIPIIEHLTNLEALPASGFTFTAVPPKIKGAGTFTVRAFATV